MEPISNRATSPGFRIGFRNRTRCASRRFGVFATSAVLLLAGAPLPGQTGYGWEPGHRHRILVPGIRFGAHYFADYSGVWKGGVRNRATYRSLTDAHLRLESEPLVGWDGTVLFLDAYAQVGRDGSLDSGDLQVYSNLDGPNRAQLASLWVEQSFDDGRFRLKVGKVDANAEFAALPNGGDFLHSSAGFSPTIVGFPSYPDPAMSFNAFWSSAKEGEDSGFHVRLGIYDGATAEGTSTGPRGPKTFFDDARSDAYFVIGEGGATWSSGTASLGAWHHTADFARFAGGVEDGTSGFYGVFDQRLYAESTDENNAQGGFAMASFGWADDDVSPMAEHYAAGLYFVGPIKYRDRDTMGFFVSHVEVSDQPGSGATQDETAFEFFYRVRVNSHLFIQPVLQYIRHPAAVAGVAKALVGTLRFECRW